ncbi:F-box protein PP2-B11-like [Salvia divinorum]
MSKNYDNWERLVGAVLKIEQFRQLALRHSTSFSTISDDASWLDEESQEFQTPVWDGVLPEDLLEIVSRSVSPVLYANHKDLYFSLCHSPILIHAGKLSFCLERNTGKKCYMVGARELGIIWCGDTPSYWEITSDPESRFSEVALLKKVCWLEIRGTMSTRMLSSHTVYGCYLVFKLDRYSYGLRSANAFVRFTNDKVDGDDERSAILVHFERENARGRHSRTGKAPVRIGDGLTEIAKVHLQRPNRSQQWESGSVAVGRGDGWMEEELGSDQGDDSDDERRAILDPFRRTGKMPVTSDRFGKWNSWGRIYRPWGRRQPHPHPSPPVRMHANGSQQQESGRVALRRGDGWMEVELGSFYNDQGGDGVVETWLLGRDGVLWKSGLIVEGIEFRPKP